MDFAPPLFSSFQRPYFFIKYFFLRNHNLAQDRRWTARILKLWKNVTSLIQFLKASTVIGERGLLIYSGIINEMNTIWNTGGYIDWRKINQEILIAGWYGSSSYSWNFDSWMSKQNSSRISRWQKWKTFVQLQKQKMSIFWSLKLSYPKSLSPSLTICFIHCHQYIHIYTQ